jgi:radical SAM superfamily enzyme YgiQ (UPF0313 family)
MISSTRPKVLLLNPPGKNIYMRDYYCSHTSKARYYWGPYDLIVLSGILNPHVDLCVIDAIADRLTPEETLERILASGCEVIVFLTGAVSWVEDFALLRQFTERHPDRYTLIGNGDILFAEDRQFLEEHPYLRAVILDFTSFDIVDFLKGEERPFAALSYRYRSGDIVPGTRAFARGEFALPLPRYDLFPYKRYHIPHGRRIPYAGILTDYGCPFHCDYCIGGELGFKFRNIDNVIEEMRYLESLGIKELWFKDLTFGANKERTRRLLNRMLDEQLRFTWVCLSRVNVLDEELLSLMKSAGCHTIQLGIETADEKLLGQYSKPFTREQVERTVAMCKKAGIRVLAHFMLGLPGDTEENINATIRLALRLKPEFASFNIAMPRMGTRFRQKALERGLVGTDVTTLDNSISYPVYETPQLSRETLWRLRNKAIRSFHLRPGFIFSRLVGVKSLYELETLFIEGIALLTTTLKTPKPSV